MQGTYSTWNKCGTHMYWTHMEVAKNSIVKNYVSVLHTMF